MNGHIVALSAAVLMLACGSERGTPPEIAYGLEECDHCRMIISEEVHSAAVVGPDGSTWTFDDIGCLLAARDGWRSDEARVWVHDVESGSWLDARRALFVRQDPASTPMGWGWIAVGTRPQAEARTGGEKPILDWEELVARGSALDEDEYDSKDDEEETL